MSKALTKDWRRNSMRAPEMDSLSIVERVSMMGW